MLECDFDRYLMRLRLTRSARFHFNHGGALMGLLCRVLQTHDLPAGVAPFACESGHVRFEAGDAYHFGLTLAGAAREGFDVGRFAASLSQIGAQPLDFEVPRPRLAGNFEVISAEPLPPPDLEAEAARLKGVTSLTLRFLSPFRLARPPELKAKGAGFLNGDCFTPEHFLQRLAYRLFLLAHGRYPEQREREELHRLISSDAAPTARPHGLLWLDIPLEGAPGKHEPQPKGYTLGGVVGRVTIGGVPESWLAPLVLGQYVSAGEKTHYGLGRYVIEECAPPGADAFRPARTLLERLSDPALLQTALNHVVSHSVAPGVDGHAPADISGAEDLLASQVSLEIETGTYSPAPLLGFVARKDDTRLRPLAVPTVRDRMVQRAACELLTPSVETLLEDCSFAYRKGFSRAGAARAIERAYEEGYRYVLDADIESFFDAVGWGRLFAKLEALYPFEPLVDLIKEWVTAPVVFERKAIPRTRGLPQGLPIAPLLANLYLDELDEELLGRDYRLVRYGDDFVVLCRDLEAAQRAREDARRKLREMGLTLSEMGLTLSETKTSVRSFDEGFTYLGYLFCRSLVMESGQEQETDTPADFTPDAIPAASWLAQVPFERVRALMQRQPPQRMLVGESASASKVQVVPLVPKSAINGAAPASTRPLYVTSFDTTVRQEGHTLVVSAPEQTPLVIPLRELSHVVCYERVRITVPVMLALSECGTPVYFCRRTGELRGIFGAPPADWRVWMEQARLASDEAARTGFARELVAAKLHNYAALVVRFRLARAAEVAEELRELERGCENKTTIEALGGLEGRGAAVYFAAVRQTLPEEWGFAGRRTQPPPDPFNALLSFGYTLLYHHLSTALVAAGLNPRIGLFHTERGTYHALACDMQEEFRHLVDAQAWAIVNRREIKPSDFCASEDGRYPCLLKPEPRKKFIGAFERRLSGEFTPPGGPTVTYRSFMERQARHLREFIEGRTARYHPLRTRGERERDRPEGAAEP